MTSLSREPPSSVTHALDTAASDAKAAEELWMELDRLAVDRALLVPTRNVTGWTLVSHRVGDHRSSPTYGPLLEQLWVR